MKRDKFSITKRLLYKSDNDLKSAKILFRAKDYAADIVFFHCQQSIEKILKAFLDFKGIRFEKTHDIEKLLEQTTEIDKSFEEIGYVAELTPYAVEFRYDEVIEASDEEVLAIIKGTEKAVKFVKGKIKC